MAAAKEKPQAKETGADLDTGQRNKLETLETVKDDITNPPEKPKGKKRGPYKKRGKKVEPEPEPMENPFDRQVVTNVWMLLFATLANKNGQPHWNLSQVEAEALTDASMGVVDKYLPAIGPYMVEINFGMTIVGVIGMRMFQTYQIKQAQKAQAEKNDTKKEKAPDAPAK